MSKRCKIYFLDFLKVSGIYIHRDGEPYFATLLQRQRFAGDPAWWTALGRGEGRARGRRTEKGEEKRGRNERRGEGEEEREGEIRERGKGKER